MTKVPHSLKMLKYNISTEMESILSIISISEVFTVVQKYKYPNPKTKVVLQRDIKNN